MDSTLVSGVAALSSFAITMAFLYSLLLKLLYPTSMALLLIALAAVAPARRRRLRQSLGVAAVAVLLVCGNGWVVTAMVRHLEGRHRPPNPMPRADAIVVLSGGILSRTPPRPSVELGDAGDRLVYAALLFKQGVAPGIVCTGNVATGGVAPRPVAEDMAELLTVLGIASDAIVTETQSENTRDHAVTVCPLLRERGAARVLLVTSALHMPRAMGVFRRGCPDLELIAAPTDFRAPDERPAPWYRTTVALLPTPRSLLDFSDAAHEYVGIAYYTLRGWM
ncbi:MAG: YdcF family protein [Vicinamibacterales bacterium]